MIPRAISQIWLGGEMPAREREWCAHWKGLNPRWNYRLWRDEDIGHYASDPYVQWMLATNAKKAFIVDRLRVLILRDFGGIYVDADCQPLRKLDTIANVFDAPHVDFMFSMRSPDRKHVALHRGISLADNTVMASAKNGRMIGRLCALYKPDAKVQNGYHMGLEVIRHTDMSVVWMNYRYFYAETEFPESILLHDVPGQNLGSWCAAPDPNHMLMRDNEALHVSIP